MVGLDGAKGAPALEKKDHFKNLAAWLTLVPVVLSILFCSGQISVWGVQSSSAQDVQSNLEVSYEGWPYEEVAPMNPAALQIIQREDGLGEGVDLVVTGVFLPTPTLDGSRSGTARTPTPVMPTPTASTTQTPTRLSITQSPSPTLTPQPPTLTLTLNVPTTTLPPKAESSATPSSTETASQPATRTVTLTPTRTKTYYFVGTATRTSTRTRRPTRTATHTVTLTPTRVILLKPSATRTESPSVTAPVTSTPTPFQTVTQTSTPTPTAISGETSTPTPTYTDTLISTASYTPEPTITLTESPTHTFTPTDTPTITWTPTDTPTLTETPTQTPDPTQLTLPPGINIGPPDGIPNEIGCGGSILVDLGSQIPIGRLVYYEVENPSDHGNIALDWVIVYVSSNATGPWTLIFYWGDSDSGNNGDVPPRYYPPENDNQPISMGELYNGTGIRIPVWGTFRYVLIEAPSNCDDPAQVDAIEVLPY